MSRLLAAENQRLARGEEGFRSTTNGEVFFWALRPSPVPLWVLVSLVPGLQSLHSTLV